MNLSTKYILLIGLILISIKPNAQIRKAAFTETRPSISFMGGASLLFAEAYPSDNSNFSIGILYEKPLSSAIGFRAKYDGGLLTGTKSYANGTNLFSTSTAMNMFSVGAYLDATNILLGVNNKRRLKLYAHGNLGLLLAKYTIDNINLDVNHIVHFGTDNNPEFIPTVNGGGGFSFKINNNWAFNMEVTGIIDFTDKVDGIAYGAVNENNQTVYNPITGVLEAYTGDIPAYPKLGSWDSFLLVQFGLKYTVGKKNKRLRGRENWRKLPSMQPF